MANEVYANNMEISCKAASGKSIAAFPDVCFTPPQAPPTPLGVPIPYPNTGLSKDTTKGTRTIRITRKEVMLKNKSYYKTSYGDEPGRAPKKGIVTSKIKGKVYFTSWSMNVKFESKNVVRHLDLTTHNHASFPGNTPPWIYSDKQTMALHKDCEEDVQKEKTACAGKKTKAEKCADDGCKKARKCLLVSYNQGKRKSGIGCCPGEQPHHLIEAHCFYEVGKRGEGDSMFFNAPADKQPYKDTESPCVCAEGPRHAGEHGQYHAFQQALEAKHHEKSGGWTYADARNAGVKANKAVNEQCNDKCTAAQLDSYHKERCGVTDSTPLRTDPQAGTRSVGTLDAKQTAALQAEIGAMSGMSAAGGSL
ncbi:TPA: DUF4150 domain-containing protein [Pseudomonas aeruginosa]|nr:DUF4150 domain-containing protein [Pseudomonas aeruginosa]